jgi:hypothetical protein
VGWLGLGLTDARSKLSTPSIAEILTLGSPALLSPVKNLRMFVHATVGRCSRRRAVPSTGVSMVDDRRARASAIRPTIARV